MNIKIEVLPHQLGSINIFPKPVYWFEMPETFKEKEKIELLQRDIWIINLDANTLNVESLKPNGIYFFNLDSGILSMRLNDLAEKYKKLKKYTQMFLDIKPGKLVLHTAHIDEHLKKYFNQPEVLYLEKNLYDSKTAINAVISTTNSILEKSGAKSRSFLRIETSDELHFTAEISESQSNRTSKPVKARIKDISLNGMGFELEDRTEINNFKLKDFIKINSSLFNYKIQLNMAIIARIDSNNGVIGVYFDLLNDKMIKEESALTYKTILYHWLKEIIKNKEFIHPE